MDRRTSSNIKKPSTPSVPEYIGLDAVIEAIRLELLNLLWIEKAYHKAFKYYKDDDTISPMVWQGHKKDMVDVIMNDNLKSFCYFVTEGEQTTTEEWESIGGNIYNKQVNLILWVNLDRVDRSKEYSYTEDLKQEVINSLSEVSLPYGSYISLLNVIESDSSTSDIFSPFTIDLVKSQYFSFPRYGYKFKMNIAFTNECVE